MTHEQQHPDEQPFRKSEAGCSDTSVTGTLDGLGAGDHDQPYYSGWKPTSRTPYPFSIRQYARLLALRSRLEAGLLPPDDLHVA